MLGSFFDLDKEIARIASNRGAAPDAAKNKCIQAYSDFDRHIQDFVRSVGEDGDHNDEARSEASPAGMTPTTGQHAAGPLHQIR